MLSTWSFVLIVVVYQCQVQPSIARGCQGLQSSNPHCGVCGNTELSVNVHPWKLTIITFFMGATYSNMMSFELTSQGHCRWFFLALGAVEVWFWLSCCHQTLTWCPVLPSGQPSGHSSVGVKDWGWQEHLKCFRWLQGPWSYCCHDCSAFPEFQWQASSPALSAFWSTFWTWICSLAILWNPSCLHRMSSAKEKTWFQGFDL